MDYSHQRYLEKVRYERAQIAAYKRTHPKEWAAKMAQIQAEDAARLALETWLDTERIARQRAADQLRIEAEKRSRSHAFAMVPRNLPRVANLDKTHGKIALREWNINNYGQLTSNGAGGAIWNSTMIADRVPSHNNSNGLYCMQITADGFLNSGNRVTDYCGLIELRGHCEVHEQESVIRAEWARIVVIYVLDNSRELYARLPLLMKNYPDVPIHVTNRSQVAKYLLRIAMWQETGDATLLNT